MHLSWFELDFLKQLEQLVPPRASCFVKINFFVAFVFWTVQTSAYALHIMQTGENYKHVRDTSRTRFINYADVELILIYC